MFKTYRFTLHYTSQFWAVLVALVGAFYFFEWLSGNMASQGSHVVTIKANAALCFLLAGLSVLFIKFQHPAIKILARNMAGVVLAIGMLTFIENFSGFNFGIDQLIAMELPGALGVAHPNRMGFLSSFSFILTGLSLLGLTMKWKNSVFLSQFSGWCVFLIGLFGFMAYGYNNSHLLGLDRFAAISLIAAINLIFLGLSLMLINPYESIMREFTSHESGKELMRRYLIPFIAIAFFTGYLKIIGERLGFYDPITGTGLRTLVFIILFSAIIYRNARALNRREIGEKLAKEALKQKERELYEAQRMAHIGSWYLDAKTFKVTSSPEVFHIQGMDPAQPLPVFSETNRHFYPLTSESWERINAAVKTALETGAGYELDLESKRADGATIWFTARGEAVRDSDGKIIALRGTVQDITDRKKDENALRNFAAVLEKRVEERTQLLEQQAVRLRELAVELTEVEQKERRRLAEVLHDHLQQYLVAAKMRLEIVERKSVNFDKEGLLDARSLIEKAVDASRVLTAELRPPVLYEGGLGAALRFLAHKIEDQHHMKAHLSLSPNIEPRTDFIKIMIYQCVQELMFNAVKYSGVEECFVKVERLADQSIFVTVGDKGKGFEPSSIGRGKKVGFGLFSIRERVKALGGELTVSSVPGEGSLFNIKVPDKGEINIEEFPGVSEERLIEGQLKTTKGHMRVLIADDHQIVRQSLASLLKAQSFIKEVIEAENGEEAVIKAESLNPDLILMDLNMPKMNGIEATRLLHSRNPDLKIIGLSVQSEFETAQAMKDVGAYAYFNKAGDTKALIETIKSLS